MRLEHMQDGHVRAEPESKELFNKKPPIKERTDPTKEPTEKAPSHWLKLEQLRKQKKQNIGL